MRGGGVPVRGVVGEWVCGLAAFVGVPGVRGVVGEWVCGLAAFVGEVRRDL